MHALLLKNALLYALSLFYNLVLIYYNSGTSLIWLTI